MYTDLKLLSAVFKHLSNIFYLYSVTIGISVESLFSQYKFNAGGKLDAVNYITSRAAHLILQCTADHHSGTSYRNKTIAVSEIPLKREKYNKYTPDTNSTID